MQHHRSDQALGILGLSVLAGGCLLVLWPFLTSIAWAAILASTSWTAFLQIDRWCGRRRVLAACVMTLLVSVVLLLPVLLATLALADNLAELGRAAATLFKEGLPEPPSWIADIPLIGSSILNFWTPLIHDGQRLSEAVLQWSAPLQGAALKGGGVLGRGVIDIGVSVFLAFFFFLNGESIARRLDLTLSHIAGARARQLVHLARNTVTGVTYGVVGTGLAQGMLAAIGFWVAGVPGAMLLGVATFFFSVIPMGPPLLWGGAALWLFKQGDIGWAVFLVAWGTLVVSTVDNIIKPLIISRGSSLPFAIVFLGVLGGVLAFGVIGAFLGPALLAIAFDVFNGWLAPDLSKT